MARYSNIEVVDENTGATLLTADERGFRNGLSEVFFAPEMYVDRLFATPLAAYMWTCLEGVWQLKAVNCKFSVTGGAGTTVDVLVSPGVTAPAGTTQLTAPISGVGTAPFSNNGVLIASPTLILPGDSISRVIAGTVASVEGIITITVKRVG